jgi:ubiquinone/menaquinone biosynthesis C-methylase UbiE
MNANDLKLIVKNKYSEIANQSKERNESSCCGSTGCCSTVDYKVFSEEYDKLEGYNPDADLGLGCGLPTSFAQIKEGDTVVDLGSGAGNDCFVARAITGEKGKVIGIDMTEAMIEKARQNTRKLKYTNVEFHLGDIENMPLSSNSADVVISNCVLNLVPDKTKAFNEIFRILKAGAHLSVSDIVLMNELPEKMKKAAELYAGCVSGALLIDDYLNVIRQAGLVNISVQQKRVLPLPTEILKDYLTIDEIAEYRKKGSGISSITVYAEKPGE